MPQICKRCLYTETHPLGIVFDDEGICSGCRIHEEKDQLDWDARWRRLEELVQPYRDNTGSKYDCIVPVSGAGDSYFIVHLVKEKLGLNPLLVTYNRYFNTPLGIRNLANLRIRFDCDILMQNVNPEAVKAVTRSALNHVGSVYWPVLAGQSVFPVQTAVRFKVPLIIWGAHQGLEQVGMFSHEHEVEMTRRYRKDHDLMGQEAYDIINLFDTLTEDDVHQFLYPDDARLNDVGVRGLYLGNFVRWDPKAQHEMMIRDHGYLGANFSRTFDTYDHTDCYAYMGVHDLLKYYKHGYSKVTDHACREIRHGRLSREGAVALVRHHRDQPAIDTQLFSEWLGMTSSGLQFLLDQHRNPLYWSQTGTKDWAFNDPLASETEDSALPDLGFIAHSELKYSNDSDNYITIGKGYP